MNNEDYAHLYKPGIFNVTLKYFLWNKTGKECTKVLLLYYQTPRVCCETSLEIFTTLKGRLIQDTDEKNDARK